MFHGLLHGETLAGIHLEQLADQVLCCAGHLRNRIVKREFSRDHLLKHLALRRSIEWELAIEHGVKDDAAAPSIYFRPVVGDVLEDLRGGVVRRPTRGLQALPVLHDVTQTEVCNL